MSVCLTCVHINACIPKHTKMKTASLLGHARLLLPRGGRGGEALDPLEAGALAHAHRRVRHPQPRQLAVRVVDLRHHPAKEQG